VAFGVRFLHSWPDTRTLHRNADASQSSIMDSFYFREEDFFYFREVDFFYFAKASIPAAYGPVVEFKLHQLIVSTRIDHHYTTQICPQVNWILSTACRTSVTLQSSFQSSKLKFAGLFCNASVKRDLRAWLRALLRAVGKVTAINRPASCHGLSMISVIHVLWKGLWMLAFFSFSLKAAKKE